MLGRSNKEKQLADQAALGDARAWDELVRRYSRPIYNVAYRFSRNRSEAEDLTQEVFLKLYRNLHLYRGDVPLTAWTLRLSKNLCIERYRRSRAERQAIRLPEDALGDVAAPDDSGSRAQRRQRLSFVHRALSEMSEDLALTLILRDLQGLSYEEAAVFLEVPMGTLKSRLVRARREVAERVARMLAIPGGVRQTSDDVREVSPC